MILTKTLCPTVKRLATAVTGNSRSGFRVKGIIEISIDFETGRSTIGTNGKKVHLTTLELNSIMRR